MAASSSRFAAPSFQLRVGRARPWPPLPLPLPPSCDRTQRGAAGRLRCCSPTEKAEEWRIERKKNAGGVARRTRAEALPSLPFSSSRSKRLSKHDFSSRCSPKNSPPESRDTPPQRDTGIASEKEWGINLLDEKVSESGQNEDGSTWYRESGEELGEKGFRCRWAKMGGKSHDGKSVWKETWWEKSDWSGYKELGAEKSGENDEGDSWWETWKEVLYQDEWSIARIERSAQKQAKSGTENAGWYEKWWEKYDAKGWTEKGAHKYGRLNEQSWWEKWGEHFDGRGFVLKWTDKWAETQMGTKWGDKWEEKFFAGLGARQGETWRASAGERWSRTWGEEHFGNGKVHKYGRSTTGESWDIVVDEETHYEAMPHYGWADVVGDSTQLLSIQPQQKPPGEFPNIKLDASAEEDGPPDENLSW
ncbi:protein RNA-directed DNA methylation 3-like isoform X2 [Zingiber officinale]|uniref:protein RNA-directed DNA methylation 3-like isoform X2 n=1 Tax=Zingiber officinale TaxID=94328 RepID=UPI001C4BF4D4|nr:protein RNA-directed DNA methylation 3-like isoform X2 [Zingiber officinale]XP_042406841.1 protein RNA-directed DNA methylation 3-like isoform X2 [Zingiber officinale]